MYIDLPDYCFAYNAKVGISTFARAIITKYFPEHESEVRQLLEENIENHHRHLYHQMVKKVLTAHKPVILMVRDPLERFLSAMAFLSLDNVEHILTALETKAKIKISAYSKPIYLHQDPHFRRQFTHLSHENYLYKFPDHINEAKNELGLDYLMRLNVSRNQKPHIENDQKSRILHFYRKDVELFNSIVKPKTLVISTTKAKWDRIYDQYYRNGNRPQEHGKFITYNGQIFKWNVSSEAIDVTKSYLKRHPWYKNIVVKDVLEHFLKELNSFVNLELDYKYLNTIL